MKYSEVSRSQIGATFAAGILLVGMLAFPRSTFSFGYYRYVGPVPVGDIHKGITDNALGFLDPRITDTIGDANANQDTNETYKNDCAHHSCNCQFRQSADWYNSQYRKVIDLLKEPQIQQSENSAAWQFGMALHGIQDFYAHSNWVAKYPNGLAIDFRLLDTGLGEWPRFEPYTVLFSKVMILQGERPEGVTVRLPVNSLGRVNGAVPLIEDRRMYNSIPPTPHTPQPPVITGAASVPANPGPAVTSTHAAAASRAVPNSAAAAAPAPADSARELPPTALVRKYIGLMTAGSMQKRPGRTYYPEQQCPPVGSDCLENSAENVCLRHGKSRGATSQFAFEGEGHMNWDNGGEGDWAKARHLAKRQTVHEWCRLLSLSHKRDPTLQATGRLLTFWVPLGRNPHPEGGYVCGREAKRSHKVRMTAAPAGSAPENIPLVMTRADFTDSKRGEVDGGESQTLEFCANAGDHVLVALTPIYLKGAGLEFVVPAAGRTWTVNDRRGAWPVRYSIKVTRGCGG